VPYRAVYCLAWDYNGKASKRLRYVRTRPPVHIRAHVLTRSQVELQLPVSQALALFVKLIRKISGNLQEIQKAAISVAIPAPITTPAQASASPHGADATISQVASAGHGLKTGAEPDAAGNEAAAALREKQRAMIDSLDLSR
jgi:N-acetyltransferase 10